MVTAATLTVGFCTFDANPNGPVQLYVAPTTVLAVKLNIPPLQTGPLLLAVGAAGAPGSDKVMVPLGADEHPFNVAIILS